MTIHAAMVSGGAAPAAPSACIVLAAEVPSDRTAHVLSEARRYGFAPALVVDAAGALAREATGFLPDLPTALSAMDDDEPVLVVSASEPVDGFNWLDLMPALAEGAAVAVAMTENGRPIMALLRSPGAVPAPRGLADIAAAHPIARRRYPARDVPATRPRPAVFFDRDGVINEDRGYVGDTSRFAFLPGAVAGVKRANDRGALAFLVTNQSGVARGFYAEADVVALHRHMTGELRRAGAHFDDIRYCPHLPDATVPAYRINCGCRKPQPGMLLDLMRRWPVDRARSVIIGDKPTDMAAARAAGITGRLYAGGALAELVDAGLDGV